MKKKFLFICLGIVLIVFAMAVSTSAAVSYSINGKAILFSGSGRMQDYRLDITTNPTGSTSYYVSSSGFYDKGFTSVTFSEGITHIGAYLFYGANYIDKINLIPESITSIGDSAFATRNGIASVTVWEGSYAHEYFKNKQNLTVVAHVSGIDLNTDAILLHLDGKKDLEATVSPNNAYYKNVMWSSSDDSIVTVDQNGTITRLKNGTVTISAKTEEGDFVASCVVYDSNYISYDLDGGQGDFSTQEKQFDKPIILHSHIPTKEGCDFVGWMDSFGNIYAPGDSFNTNSDFLLKAVWTPKIYNVIYDANGGKSAPEAQMKTHDIAITLSEIIPSRVGYDFLHWETTGQGTKQLSVSGLESAHNYANNTSKTWTISSVGAKSITLTFDSRTAFESNYDFLYIYDQNGTLFEKYSGTALAGETLTVQGESVKLKLTSDSSNVKWGFAVTSATAEGDINVYYAPGESFLKNEDTILYAVWEEKTYDVIYDANGGVGSPSNAKKYYFSNYTISSATPLMEGYDFKEWSGSDGNTYNPGDVYSKNTNLTLSAVWTVKKFEITYDANGGDGGPESSYKEYFSDYVISPTIPSKEGNTFRYWRGSDGKTYYPGDTYSQNQALSLTAVWKLYSYEIIFDVNGGNEVFADEIKYFDVDFVIFSDIPTKEGYKFIGWQGSDGNTYNGGDVYTGNSDLTLTAVWELKVYSITYDANGGSNVPENGTKEHFLDFTISNTTPTLTGYDFVGWRGSDGKTYYPNDTYSTNANVVLTAIWQLKTFTLFYDANGGIVASVGKDVQYSKRIGTLDTPNRTGYTFDGWYTEKDGGTRVTSESIVEGIGSFTIYAHWSANTYNVTFNVDGGTILVPIIQVIFDSTYEGLPVPTKTGYTFDGWYTDDDKLITAETIVKTPSDHKLTAHWSENSYFITFDANGGDCETTSIVVVYNQTYGELPVPTRKGFTFGAWSTSATIANYVTKDSVYTYAGNSILYAIWIPNNYKLLFNANGGHLDITDKTVVFGSKYGNLPVPIRENFVFTGWYIDPELTTKANSDSIVDTDSDINLYAAWIPVGDPNSDGVINVVDAVLLAQHLAGWNVDINEEASDCNGDGVVNVVDAVLLAQYLAGWDVVLG